MWNLKYDTSEIIYEAEFVLRHRKQIYGYQRKRRGCKLGAWVLQIHTTVYEIDKQQGPTE